MVMKEGVKVHYKSVTVNVFTVVGPLVGTISTDISNTKGYLDVSIYISQPPITLTSNSPVIPPSLPSVA